MMINESTPLLDEDFDPTNLAAIEAELIGHDHVADLALKKYSLLRDHQLAHHLGKEFGDPVHDRIISDIKALQPTIDKAFAGMWN